MVSVAQKTLFLTFLAFFGIFFTKINNSYALDDIFKPETLRYKVSLNGLSLGNAVISYQPNVEKHNYKLLATTKTKGFAKNLYNINDSIIVNGHINNNQLNPNNQTMILKENGYKANKTAIFDYKKSMLTVRNNRNSDSWIFSMLNKTKDIFSTMYTLRFNTDLVKNEKAQVIEKTVQFVDKTLNNKIYISAPFYYKINKETRIKARNIVVESQRIKINPLSKHTLALIDSNEKKAADFMQESINKNKKYKSEKNIRIVVSSDKKKIPLIIQYSTKFGTFKAVLLKAN